MEGALTAEASVPDRNGPRSIAPVGVAIIEASEMEQIDLGAMPRWHLIVLHEGSPVTRLELPSPGAGGGETLAAAAIARRADHEIARRRLAESLRTRLGAAVETPRRSGPSCSVVVCTHRRPHYLSTLLAALADLDPAPTEIIVVDNDPGEQDCRVQVAELGARYVREDRRGLDNARNAGVRAAACEIVAFTDDDCVPSKGWLKPLATAFDRSDVAALTGPAFPYRLDTTARVRVEQQASLARGLRRIAFDWQLISPLQAAAAGVGANMAIRRELLDELGPEPFPPELDAGTPTESGGDIALLAALLARGCRIVYEPDMFVRHQHRPDWPALRSAVRGYGIGLSAALTKLSFEELELSSLRASTWLVEQYLTAQARRLMGHGDAVSTRIACEYLRGAFIGPTRWRRSLAEQRRYGTLPVAANRPSRLLSATGRRSPGRGSPVGSEPAAPAPSRSEAPSVSVVVPTAGRRREALARCLEALTRQRGGTSFEVVLVDDGTPASLSDSDLPEALDGRVIATGGAGAAAARNAGARAARAELLLFLDDDVLAGPDLVAVHHRRQSAAGGCLVVVGPYLPRARGRSLAADSVTLWWSDFFARMETAISHTFVSALTGNLSVPSRTFLDIGGFDEAFPRSGREDWEWGVRMLEAGVTIAYEPSAEAWHEFDLDAAGRLGAARLEGHGDAMIVSRHPHAVGSLPITLQRPGGVHEPILRLVRVLWSIGALRRAGMPVLALLEWAKLRQAWWSIFKLMQAASYAQGLRDAGYRLRDLPAPMAVDLALDEDDPIAAPRSVAPVLRLTLEGKEIGRVAPVEGQWSSELGEQIADHVPWSVLGPLAADRGWVPHVAEPSSRAGDVDVLLGADCGESGAALVESGARVVEVPSGAAWWDHVLRLARGDGRPLVAIPLPSVRPDRRWLNEVLVAFDADRVGAVTGGSLHDDDPLASLHLHDEEPSWQPPDSPPRYLILRRELAAQVLPPGHRGRSEVGCLLVAARLVVARGWILAHRAVHGLSGPGPGRRELGRAWGTELAIELLDPTGSSADGPGRALLATRAGAALGYETLRYLRRPSSPSRQQLSGAAIGLAAGAVAARRRRGA